MVVLAHMQGLIFNEMRSKTKCFDAPLSHDPKEYPDWSYDGSSTGQASGNNSDCILRCALQPGFQLPQMLVKEAD